MSGDYIVYKEPNIVDLLLIKKDLESGKSVLLSYPRDIAKRHSMIMNNPLMINSIYFHVMRSCNIAHTDYMNREITLINKSSEFFQRKYKDLVYSQRTRILSYDFKSLYTLFSLKYHQGLRFNSLEGFNRSHLYTFQNVLNFNDIVIKEVLENREKYKGRFHVVTNRGYKQVNSRDSNFTCLLDELTIEKSVILENKDSPLSPYNEEILELNDPSTKSNKNSRINLLSVIYNSSNENIFIKETVSLNSYKWFKDILLTKLYKSYLLRNTKEEAEKSADFKGSFFDKFRSIKRSFSLRYYLFRASNHGEIIDNIYKPSPLVKDISKYEDTLKFIDEQNKKVSTEYKSKLKSEIDFNYQRFRNTLQYTEFKHMIEKYNLENTLTMVSQIKKGFTIGSKYKKTILDSEIKFNIENLYLKNPLDFLFYRTDYLQGSNAGRNIIGDKGFKLDQILPLSKYLNDCTDSEIKESKIFLFKNLLIYYSLFNKPL